MLNTGTTTGIFVNEFQIGLSAKVSPSFTWGNNRYEINKAIQTASEVMRRRDQELTHAMEALIRDIWQKPETTLRWS
ncbi:MAG: glucose-1-phosphate thymidylyltransferase, partial [Candidatus Marinimicrobia bacterium CG_4_9_14_3_um_filter_48_9]